jgi:hypothetical protein
VARRGDIHLITVWLPILSLASCATGHEAQTRAFEIEGLQCDANTTGPDAEIVMRETTVLSVAPIYSDIHSVRTGTEARVSGTKLVVCLPQGIRTDYLIRILQCHTARAAVGRFEPPFPNDPYSLPGEPLHIDVINEQGWPTVTIEANSVSKNLAVLAHARAYADQHRRFSDLAVCGSDCANCVR